MKLTMELELDKEDFRAAAEAYEDDYSFNDVTPQDALEYIFTTKFGLEETDNASVFIRVLTSEQKAELLSRFAEGYRDYIMDQLTKQLKLA